MRTLIRSAATILTMLLAGPVVAQDEVTFGTDWYAQAEHGGYYQALADGTYERFGLAVTIRQGGPQAANRALLTGGQIQFYMGTMIPAIDAVKEEIPTITIASIFQKGPLALLAHPDAGFETFDDLADASKYIIGKDGFIAYFQWMKGRNPKFVDEKYEPYTFNLAPFLADPKAIQQGYVTSEPYSVAQQTGWTPKAFLLADYGYPAYSTTIETMKPWLDANRDVARRFVEASILGWYNFLYGDNRAARDLILADNPEMTDDRIDNSIARMKEYGIVVSGDAVEHGIGCMTDARWQAFYDELLEVGVFEPGIDIKQAYTTEFVCHGLGKDLVK